MAVQQVILKTDPQRPVSYNEKAVKAVLDRVGLIADVKKDGVRLNLIVRPVGDAWEVLWLSREGKEFPALAQGSHEPSPLSFDARWAKFFNEHLDGGLYPNGFMLDAEMIIEDAHGEPLACKDTAGTLRRHQAIDPGRIRVYAFGLIPLDVIESGEEYDCTHGLMKYHTEFQVGALKNRFPEIQWSVVESLDIFTMEDLELYYEAVREKREEGLVLKDPTDNWKRGKKTGQWKMVPDDNEDGVIQGLVWGTEGKANEGKVIGFEVLLESGHVVNACKISRALMDQFTATVKGLGEDYFNGHIVKVTYMERYPDGSLRHPSFDSFRGITDPFVKE